ncbi:MFS transporter [Aliikangiella maris]|uniref:MFS transporter n=2 Tax=Aliikangiella maris TaxID=3162458 RepID=A0ABV3MNW1_9GAMM
MNALKARLILATIMLVSLLGTAGIALPYPLLSPYFAADNSENIIQFWSLDPKILLGLTLASYPLGILIGSNIIGSLSDRYGRKPILIYSLSGSILGYMLTAITFEHELFLGFIFARFVTGFCEGNMAIARAIAVELEPYIERGRALSLLYSTIYGGWLIGPLCGGYLAPYGIDFAFYVASLAVAASLLMVIFILPGQPAQKPAQSSLWQEIISNHSATLLANREIRRFFIYYLVFTLGINAFYEFYPLWLVESHQFSSQEIAWATVGITSLMILLSATIANKIPEVLGEKTALLVGNLLFGGLILLTTLMHNQWIYITLSLTGAVIAVINLVFPAMLSRYFGHLGQGKVMGLQVSFFCFSNVLIALIGSIVSLISATTTMWLAASLIILSVFLFNPPKSLEISAGDQPIDPSIIKE